jgi:hypothetical protein
MLLAPMTPDQINERLAETDLVAELKEAAPEVADAKAKKVAKFIAETPELALLLSRLFSITNPVTVDA